MSLTEKVLAKLDEDIKGVESWLLSVIEVNEEGFFKREIARAKTHLAITKALRRQVEKQPNVIDEGDWGDFERGVLQGYNKRITDAKLEIAHDLGIEGGV